MYQGKVKWFNNAKGYGFIVEDGKSEDLFAHFSSIQMEGYRTLKAGQPVSFDKQPSGKGTHAVNICALETANRTDAMLDDEVISVEEPTNIHRDFTPAQATETKQAVTES